MLRLAQLAVVFALGLVTGFASVQEPENSHEVFEVELTATKYFTATATQHLDVEVLWWGTNEYDHYLLPEPLKITTSLPGSVSFTLSPPPAACKQYGTRLSTLGLRCRDPRHSGDHSEVELTWKNGLYEGELLARSSKKLSGRVLDPQGKPTSATVRIESKGDSLIEFEDVVIAVGESGLFELDDFRLGDLELSATKAGVGVSTWTESALDGQWGIDEFVLQLEGSGIIAGHVVDCAGHAMPNLPMRVEWDSELGDQPTLEDGITQDSTTTNDAGEFRFAGLKPGNYRVGYMVYPDSETENAITVATGTLDTELRFARPVLSIRLLDANGEAVSPVDFKLRNSAPNPAGFEFAELLTWSDANTRSLYLDPGEFELIDLDHPHASIGLPEESALEVPATPGAPGLSLYVRAGKRYQLNLRPHEGPVLTAEVTISETDTRPQIELRLPKPADLGSLRIEIREADETLIQDESEPLFPSPYPLGNRFNRFPPVPQNFFSIRHVDSELVSLSGTFPCESHSIQLETGKYWVTVRIDDAGITSRYSASSYPSFANRFYFHQLVHIEAGQESFLLVKPEAVYPIGFRLHFNDDREALAEIPMSAVTVRSLGESISLSVHWTSQGGPFSNLSAFGIARCSLELFPPGKYELMFAYPGFESVLREFEISGSSPVIELRLTR